MRSYSKLNCPEVIYNELERFIHYKDYIFLTRKLTDNNIQIKKYNVNDSFETVEKYIDLHGGKIIYGISILESDIIFEKEVFAVWESPDKTIHHITRGSNAKIMFIPNENPYAIPNGYVSDFYNFFSTKEESCIKEFIENKRYFQELISKEKNSLTEAEIKDICRYGNTSISERMTNKKIDKDFDLRNKILSRVKK
ncbi:hypothetical protein [Cetobacterium sp.]|uniref:hypothetical protein n=1 Tax=Cetobacterium sp. TaxID=2071632 RepID=UPI003F2F7E96